MFPTDWPSTWSPWAGRSRDAGLRVALASPSTPTSPPAGQPVARRRRAARRVPRHPRPVRRARRRGRRHHDAQARDRHLPGDRARPDHHWPRRSPASTSSPAAGSCSASGGGWNREEMENHGTEPAARWRLMRERMLAMKEIWTKDEAEYHGELRRLRPDLAVAQAGPEAAPADHHRRRRARRARAGRWSTATAGCRSGGPTPAARSRPPRGAAAAGRGSRPRSHPGHALLGAPPARGHRALRRTWASNAAIFMRPAARGRRRPAQARRGGGAGPKILWIELSLRALAEIFPCDLSLRRPDECTMGSRHSDGVSCTLTPSVTDLGRAHDRHDDR